MSFSTQINLSLSKTKYYSIVPMSLLTFGLYFLALECFRILRLVRQIRSHCSPRPYDANLAVHCLW